MASRKWKTSKSKSEGRKSIIDPTELAKPASNLTDKERKKVSRQTSTQPVVETTEREATGAEVTKAIRGARAERGVTQSGAARRDPASAPAKSAAQKREEQRTEAGEAVAATIAKGGDVLGRAVNIEGLSKGTKRRLGADEVVDIDTSVGGFESPESMAVQRDEPRQMSPAEIAMRDRIANQRAEETRGRAIGKVTYTRKKRDKDIGPMGGTGSSRIPVTSAPDVPVDLRGALARQQFFGVNEEVVRDASGAKKTVFSKKLRTDNPPVERLPVADPTKEMGVGTELRPIPTPLTRESVYQSYVAPAQRQLEEVLGAKEAAEAVEALDVRRAGMPREFVPETNKPETKTELRDGKWVTTETTKTGSVVSPSRRQALSSLRREGGAGDITDPAEKAAALGDEATRRALTGSLEVGIRKTAGAPRSISKVLDTVGSPALSEQFLGNIRDIAAETKTIQEQAETPEGRAALIEGGTRFVNERGRLARKGGLTDLGGTELKDLLSPEDYESEVAKAVELSPGSEVGPRPSKQGPSSIGSSVKPALAEEVGLSEVVSATDLSGTPKKNPQARIEAVLTEASRRGQLEETRSQLLKAGRPDISVSPMVASEEKAPQRPGEPTVRGKVTSTFGRLAQGSRRLASGAGVLGRNTGRFTSSKAARMVGAESATEKSIRETMEDYPGRTRQVRGRRDMSRGVPFYNPQLTWTDTGAIAHVVGGSDKELARAAATGDQHAEMFLSGRLNPVSVLPGGALGKVGGATTEPVKGGPMYGTTAKEREASRSAAIQRSNVSEAEARTAARQSRQAAEAAKQAKGIGGETIYPNVRDIMSGRAAGGRVVETPQQRESRIVSESMGAVAFSGSPMAQMQSEVSRRTAGPETRALMTPTVSESPRENLAVVRDVATARTAGVAGAILPSSRVTRLNPTTGEWEKVSKSSLNNPTQFGGL